MSKKDGKPPIPRHLWKSKRNARLQKKAQQARFAPARRAPARRTPARRAPARRAPVQRLARAAHRIVEVVQTRYPKGEVRSRVHFRGPKGERSIVEGASDSARIRALWQAAKEQGIPVDTPIAAQVVGDPARGHRAQHPGWIQIAPLAKVIVLGGGYLRSPDGRVVIFVSRYRHGDPGRRKYSNHFHVVEYINGATYTTGGPRRVLLECTTNLSKAKAAGQTAGATLRGAR